MSCVNDSHQRHIKHKLLLDLGPSEETLRNAEGGRYKYIGIDKNISEDIVYEVA